MTARPRIIPAGASWRNTPDVRVNARNGGEGCAVAAFGLAYLSLWIVVSVLGACVQQWLAGGRLFRTPLARVRASATLETMLIAATALVAATLAPQPQAEPPKVDLAVISARLGDCSADFTVKDADDRPIYAALIHVRIRYGFMNLKRMDLEVGTNSDGRARVEGLPTKTRPLTYDVSQDDKKATVEQDVTSSCRANYELTLK